MGSPFQRENPFIHSTLLDTDLYQFLMLNFIFWVMVATPEEQTQHLGKILSIFHNNGQRVEIPEVTYRLTHRPNKDGSKTPLAQKLSIEEIRRQLDHVSSLQLTESDIEYLGSLAGSDGQPFFLPPFLEWLAKIRLPQVVVEEKNGDLNISVTGPWHHTLLWETYIMNILTELLTARGLNSYKKRVQALVAGMDIMRQQLSIIAKNPGLIVAEFGTRRRASKKWQKWFLENFIATQRDNNNHLPVKTSNVEMARLLKIESMGTMAHQLFMIFMALLSTEDDEAQALVSQQEVVTKWWDLYGYDFSIFLPDTFTSEAFFKMMDPEIARKSKGFRHDSGDPDEFARKVYDFFHNKCGLSDQEIKKKVIIFSDGLDVETALAIYNRWKEVFTVGFGIGTSLTNNLGPYGSQESLVVKPESVTNKDGQKQPVLKISDDPGKLTGDPDARERVMGLINTTMASHNNPSTL